MKLLKQTVNRTDSSAFHIRIHCEVKERARFFKSQRIANLGSLARESFW